MRKQTSILLFMGILCGLVSASVQDSLVQYLRFDTEENGMSPALVGTDATLMGNATITTGGQGISGEALQLDGESFAQLMDYKGIGGNAPRTVSLWVRTTVNQANGSIFIGWGNTGTGARVRYDLGLESGTTDQLRNEFNAGFATSATGTTITDNAWHHIAATYDGSRGVAFYLDGQLYGTAALGWNLNTQLTEDVVIGTGIRQAYAGYTTARWTEGLIDDVQIYNTALSQADIQWLYNHPGQVISQPRVINPIPAHGSAFVNPTDTMQWELFNASDAAYSIHIGTDSDCSDVLAGHNTGSQASYTPPPGLLSYGTTYYWRVDIVHEEVHYPGEVWSFSTGGAASDPVPEDQTVVPSGIYEIGWTGDDLVDSYNVYFGFEGALALAGNFTTPSVSFAELALALGLDVLPGGVTYQWRVDTLDASGEVMVTGPVWTMLLEYSYYGVLEDFNAYPDTDAMEQVWTGFGQAAISLDPLLNIMNYEYDCSTPPYAGQAVMTIEADQDWVDAGWQSMDILFRGDQGNTPALLSITLSDGTHSATVSHPDPDAVTTVHWQQWNLRLADFSEQGVNLNHIVSLTVNVGDGTAGGAGTIYLNDILLHPHRCLPTHTAVGDVNRDCRVDIQDFLLLVEDWLKSDYAVHAAEPHGRTLAAYYPFNEQSGSTAYDFSGGNHHATIVAENPDALWEPNGYDQGSIRLDDIDSYVLLPAEVFAGIDDAVTIAFWMQGTASDWPYQVDSAQFSAGPVPRKASGWDSTEWNIDQAEFYGQSWSHFAFVKDRNSGVVQIFHNGILVAQNSDAFSFLTAPEAGPTRLSLASDVSGPVKIDELRIYGDALTDAEIVYLAAGPSGQITQPIKPVFTQADLTDDGHVGLADLALIAQGWMRYSFWP